MVEKFMVYDNNKKDTVKDANGEDIVGTLGEVEDYLTEDGSVTIVSMLNGIEYTYKDIYG